MGFFDSSSSNSTSNYSSDSHAVSTTNTNIDQSQVQTSSQEISVNHTNSDNSSWSKVTDASVKALDSFNKNFNIQNALSVMAPGDPSGIGTGLDMNSFFGDQPIPFSAGADRAVGDFFDSPALAGKSASGSFFSPMKIIILAVVGFAIYWFVIRKK